MDRRSALRALAGAAAVPLLTPDLHALARSVHAAAQHRAKQVLDPHQDATVTAISDLIIPATDTPGAKAAKVCDFVDVLLTDWYEPKDRDKILAGIADVDARSHIAFAKDFVDGTPDQQTAVLTQLDLEATRWHDLPEATRGPAPFYRTIKWLTLYGYYTSEIGAEQEDHFEIIPGAYRACIPVHGPAAPTPGGM